MLQRLWPWLSAHPRWTLTWLVILALAPFLAKPFNIDDPLFIWLAKQVQQHPGDPFGFTVNWYGKTQPMWEVTENPPLAGYYFALAGGILGWSEVALHLAGLLPALAVVLGTHRLASRFSQNPLLAAVLVLFTPIFLVSASTVMCDVLMLAFWVWAMVFWVEGIDEDRRAKLLMAGGLVALAMLAKYVAGALIPLLALYGGMRKRQAGLWVLGLLLPVLVVGVYACFVQARYGHGGIPGLADFVKRAQQQQGFAKVARGLMAMAFMGGGAASVVFCAVVILKKRMLVGPVAGMAVAGVVICFAGWLPKYGQLDGPTVKMWVMVQLIFWAAGGGVVLLQAALELMENRKDAASWLLGLWVMGILVFTAFGNWTVNGRSLLPMLPALGILLARRCPGEILHPRPMRMALGIGAALSLMVMWSDYRLAIAARQSAREAMTGYGGGAGKVWFEGHWGFQYYMEQLGAQAVDFNHFVPATGDWLVIPAHNTYLMPPIQEMVVRAGMLNVTNRTLVTTWNNPVGAGFYSAVAGPLPFAFGKVPNETLLVYELKAVESR